MHQSFSRLPSHSLVKAGRLPEVLPEALERPVVVVAQRADRPAEVGQVAHLEQRVPGVGGQSAEQVGPEHRGDHGAVAAARFARDAAVVAVGERPVLRVDPGDDLLAEVRVVPAGAGRVEELAPPERGPAVDPHQDAGRGLPARRTARRRARGSSGGTGRGCATCRAVRSGPGSCRCSGTCGSGRRRSPAAA